MSVLRILVLLAAAANLPAHAKLPVRGAAPESSIRWQSCLNSGFQRWFEDTPPCQDSCRLELKNFRGPETTKMNTYSPERKAALIARMMPPHNQSVVQLARSEGIPANTLYAWRTQAGVGAAESLSPAEWSQDARFAVLVETAALSAHAVAEYCRRKGLYPEQIQQWRDEFMQPNPREERAEIKRLKKENQQLNREIARKDKALAEAAALLILEKKLKAFFAEEREDE
ncbi:transposase [Serratia ficaria]|uniref:transposase n=6 Tax=Serratia TaxID=613 RepID=UPI0021CAC414|nr:transposase [Serratia ficaria]